MIFWTVWTLLLLAAAAAPQAREGKEPLINRRRASSLCASMAENCDGGVCGLPGAGQGAGRDQLEARAFIFIKIIFIFIFIKIKIRLVNNTEVRFVTAGPEV